ncbi:MAG: aspartate carbamoyltransferase regulatory subunit, partial [Clostridia bacterium]|nr:aspartate carbamoyltransferase regulatory subunit [Clostridia bacterium]
MTVDEIKNGIVIDHITAGLGMKIYTLLKLENLACSVALINNADSRKMGKKDIIKI